MPFVSHGGHCSRAPLSLCWLHQPPSNTELQPKFPKSCYLTCMRYSFCLEHFPHLFPSQISLILQGNQLRHHLLQEAHQIDPLSDQEPLLGPRAPWAFTVTAVVTLGLCPHDTHLHNRHMTNIGRLKCLEKEVNFVCPWDHGESGLGWGQHLKEHSKNSSTPRSLGCLGK